MAWGDREIINARIDSTSLGNPDHGIFSAWLNLGWDGGGQGFGGYRLDAQASKDDYENRIGTRWGLEHIMRIMTVVGVEKWEDLPGKHVRIDHDNGKIHRIGNLLKEAWYDPKEHAEKLQAEGKI